MGHSTNRITSPGISTITVAYRRGACAPRFTTAPMKQGNVIRLEVPANYNYLNILGNCAATMLEQVEGLTGLQTVTYNIQLAIHEACTNIIRHAYANKPGGKIEATFTLETTPQRLIVELADTGQSFNPADVPDPDLNGLPEGGLGLYLIRALMDEITYYPQPGNNRWRLVKNFNTGN